MESALGSFVAIDFETAGYERDSACSIGLVRVEKGAIVDRQQRLIRPPRDLSAAGAFKFTEIHGLTWDHVKDAQPFSEVWSALEPMVAGVDFLAAHYAQFDSGVLSECGAVVALPFLCTVRLAREAWGIFPTKLPIVCARLGIELQHHNALSDAEACARIVIAAMGAGWNCDKLRRLCA